MSGILANSTIGILTSLSEGLPVSLLEYASLNLPVVCTDVGQCKEVVGNNGWIVPSKDVQAFSKALQELIDNKESLNEKAQALHQRVLELYSEKGAVKTLLEIYK